MSEIGFRIEQSSKAFEILANNLYKDKILAVIRELCCNAHDAHVEADNPTRKFHVHIPTIREPWFQIRDFGKGLTTEQVEEIFTVFFASTKTGSSAFTGSFGLGAKTPFAIVNEFCVNSYQNNTVTKYVCKKKGGVPVIECLNVESSTEENGLEIKFSLSGTTDFYESTWSEKAVAVLDAFKLVPTTNISINYSHAKSGYDCGSNWEILPDLKGIYIQMGNVRYPLVATMLPKFLQTYKNVFKNGWNYNYDAICLHIPQKSIEITPSREEISYDENTIAFLESYLPKVFDDYEKHIRQKLDSCEYLNETISVYAELVEKNDNLLWASIDRSTLTHKGEPILNKIHEPHVNLANKIAKADSEIKETIGDDSAIPFVFGSEIILHHSSRTEKSFKKIKDELITSKTSEISLPLKDENRAKICFLIINKDIEVDSVRAARFVAMYAHDNGGCPKNHHIKIIMLEDADLFCDLVNFDKAKIKNLSEIYKNYSKSSDGTVITKRIKTKDERFYFKIFNCYGDYKGSHATVGFDNAVAEILKLYEKEDKILFLATDESVAKHDIPMYYIDEVKSTDTKTLIRFPHVAPSLFDVAPPDLHVLVVRNTRFTRKILQKIAKTKQVVNFMQFVVDTVRETYNKDKDLDLIFKSQMANAIWKSSSGKFPVIEAFFTKVFNNGKVHVDKKDNSMLHAFTKIINADGIFAADPFVVEFHNKFHDTFGKSFSYFCMFTQIDSIRQKTTRYHHMQDYLPAHHFSEFPNIKSFDSSKFFDSEKLTDFCKFMETFIIYLQNTYGSFISTNYNADRIRNSLFNLYTTGKISKEDLDISLKVTE